MGFSPSESKIDSSYTVPPLGGFLESPGADLNASRSLASFAVTAASKIRQLEHDLEATRREVARERELRELESRL